MSRLACLLLAPRLACGTAWRIERAVIRIEKKSGGDDDDDDGDELHDCEVL